MNVAIRMTILVARWVASRTSATTQARATSDLVLGGDGSRALPTVSLVGFDPWRPRSHLERSALRIMCMSRQDAEKAPSPSDTVDGSAASVDVVV